MRRPASIINTIFLIAACGHLALGLAQNRPENTPPACPMPAEVVGVHLYGAWQARWDGVAETATLTLWRSEDYPDGLRGIIRRGAGAAATEVLVSAEVDQATFAMEESRDGRAISATWNGAFTEQSCGKEIRGQWTDSATRTERAFVLRKLGGWQ